MRPEYGASTHVARVLLTVISHDKSVRAAINLRYDERMANVLHSLRISHLTIPESSKRRSDAALLEELSRELRSAGTPIVAVVDEGGAGIEPELYLFAADPVAVAQLGLKVARSYVGGLARLVG